ncbi:MAG: arylesterase [Bryobacterales bacterium]|nr:arylesterase [Bryobacterales bacterium]
MRHSILLLAFFGPLFSCGGPAKDEVRHPSPSPPPAAQQSAPADTRPVIVAFGDSLSAGYGLEPGLSYPDFLQKNLDAAGYSYRIVNEGISGDTSSGGLERVPSVLAHKPAIVILELGANDGLRGIPVAQTRDNLDQILTQLKASGASVLLAGITLPRNYGELYIRDFDRIYPGLAAKHGVPRLPFLLEGVVLNPKLMQRDALHPTAEGCRIVARNVFTALQPLLKK